MPFFLSIHSRRRGKWIIKNKNERVNVVVWVNGKRKWEKHLKRNCSVTAPKKWSIFEVEHMSNTDSHSLETGDEFLGHEPFPTLPDSEFRKKLASMTPLNFSLLSYFPKPSNINISKFFTVFNSLYHLLTKRNKRAKKFLEYFYFRFRVRLSSNSL